MRAGKSAWKKIKKGKKDAGEKIRIKDFISSAWPMIMWSAR